MVAYPPGESSLSLCGPVKGVKIKGVVADTVYERMDQSMTIERLGPVDPIRKYNKTEPVQRTDARGDADSIQLSSEAKVRSELLQAIDQARDIPDIRQDRVAEVRQKLEDPSYINDRIVEAVADEILSVFDIT